MVEIAEPFQNHNVCNATSHMSFKPDFLDHTLHAHSNRLQAVHVFMWSLLCALMIALWLGGNRKASVCVCVCAGLNCSRICTTHTGMFFYFISNWHVRSRKTRAHKLDSPSLLVVFVSWSTPPMVPSPAGICDKESWSPRSLSWTPGKKRKKKIRSESVFVLKSITQSCPTRFLIHFVDLSASQRVPLICQHL